MTAVLTKEQTKDLSAFMKIVKAVKKFIAKEFLWILLVIVLSIPTAFILMWIVQTFVPANDLKIIIENDKGYPLFAYAYVVSVVGIYFSRMVVSALKTLVNKKQ